MFWCHDREMRRFLPIVLQWVTLVLSLMLILLVTILLLWNSTLILLIYHSSVNDALFRQEWTSGSHLNIGDKL